VTEWTTTRAQLQVAAAAASRNQRRPPLVAGFDKKVLIDTRQSGVTQTRRIIFTAVGEWVDEHL